MANKYLTIYKDLVQKIEQGSIAENTKLASENQLAEEYDAARGTIRKALNLLSQNGYIQKIKGKGSFVLDVQKFDFPVSGVVSFKELAAKLEGEAVTKVLDLEQIEPTDIWQAKLNLAANDKLWKVVRVREIDGEKIILDQDFLKQEFIPQLTEEICADSLYEYIEDKLGLTISFAKKEISVEGATKQDEKLLDLAGYEVVVVVKSFVYLDDASVFQYTESRHRPDKFKFVDFARRSQ